MYLKVRSDQMNEWMTVLFFGILSAISGNFHLDIPGLVSGTTDPREVIALSSVFFLRDWKSTLAVGFLAAFGGPYDDTMPLTIVMHILAIPAAWFFYQWDRRRIKSQLNIILSWAFQVVILYFGIYMTSLTVGMWALGKIEFVDCWKTYSAVYAGVRLELVFTTITTSLILALRLSRAELNKEAQLLNLFIQSEDFGIWEWNTQNDELSLSKLWQKKLGITPKDNGMSMQQYIRLIHPDDRTQFEQNIKELAAGNIRYMHIEYRLNRGQEECCWVFNSAQRMDDKMFGIDTGNVVGVLMDISEKKRTEKEKEKLRQQLIQAQKMESIGTLAGGIAHDFNNLLTVINGHAELAAHKLEGNQKVQKDLLAIESAGKKAVRLTSQLLAFSRQQIYEPRSIDLNTVVKELHKMLARLIGEDIHIEMILEEAIPPVKADPVQIEQILLNLMINARDAINEVTDIAGEKKITIETGKADLHSTYQHSQETKPQGEFVILSVSDNGKGMDKETVERIFDPFFTTKDKGKGTGLGLATVYGIVTQNKGHISVYSEPGIGTTFKIYWPVCKENGSTEIRTEHEITRLSGSETIIYVEDDTLVREFAVSVLSDFGYTVHSCARGKEALKLITQSNIRPDLLVTDLIMPEMNGKELAEQLLDIFPACPVLYTSGYTDNHIVHNGSLDKGVNFLHKPFTTQELLKKIRKTLDK